MKTAEHYYNEQAGRSDMGWSVELNQSEYLDHVRQIQLDAIKEGMNRAANLARAFSSLEVNTPEQLEKESEQLTLKDL